MGISNNHKKFQKGLLRMTEYLTHDVLLDLGGEAPEDLTLNMLRFASRGTTLVVARSPVTHNKTLDEAVGEQLNMLARNRRQ
jgi:Domain of unknown function (DUF1795).